MGGRKGCRLCFSPRVLGTSFEATSWRSFDPCGLMGITCSLGVHLFAFGTIVCHLIEANMFSTSVFVLVYTPVTLLAVAALYMAWATDPGSVPMGARPLVTVRRAGSGELQTSASRQRALRRCHKCDDNYKPNRAHHDSVTGRCIGQSPSFDQRLSGNHSLGMSFDTALSICILTLFSILSLYAVKFDHFCPWVGNAVGAMNHKFFVLFVGYTMCSCILSLVLIFVRALHCGFVADDSDDPSRMVNANANAHGNDLQENTTANGSVEDQDRRFLEVHYRDECAGFYNSYATLVLLIVSVVFMIFTCCMLFEQIEAIETNSSKIARMKMRVGQAGTELARVTEEFNEMFGGSSNEVAWHWFLPTQVDFPRGMKKVVLGYEWDETFDAAPYEEPSGTHTSNGMTSGGSVTGRDEEEGAVELTSAISSRKPASAPSSLNHMTSFPSDDGEEGSFSGTPVVKGKGRRLNQRRNSRDPETRHKPDHGTLT